MAWVILDSISLDNVLCSTLMDKKIYLEEKNFTKNNQSYLLFYDEN